jgi:hypothetical protein
MPIIRNIGGPTARQLGDRLLQTGIHTRDEADTLRVQTIQSEREKRDAIGASARDFAEQQAARRAARRGGRAGKKGAAGAGIGTGVGAIIGGVLAPFTAGLSLLGGIAAGAAIGGGVGGAVGSALEDSPGAGERAVAYGQSATQGLSRAAESADRNALAAKTIDATKNAGTEVLPGSFPSADEGTGETAASKGDTTSDKVTAFTEERDKPTYATGFVQPDTPQEGLIFLGGDLYYDPSTGTTKRIDPIDAARARLNPDYRSYGAEPSASDDEYLKSLLPPSELFKESEN